MNVKVNGKGIDIGNSLRDFVVAEISNLSDKYFGNHVESVATISKNNKLFCVEAVMYLSKGFVIKTNGSSDDPYKAVSLALEKLEGKIKKHKNRVKDKHRRSNWEDNVLAATGYVIERKDSSDESKDEEHLIIAEQDRYILSLSVSEAVMKLDLTDSPVVMFKNADTERINVVYKRSDGHIGWFDYKENQ